MTRELTPEQEAMDTAAKLAGQTVLLEDVEAEVLKLTWTEMVPLRAGTPIYRARRFAGHVRFLILEGETWARSYMVRGPVLLGGVEVPRGLP